MSRLPLLIVALMFAGVIASVVIVNGRPGADPSGKDAMVPALAVVVVGMLAIVVVQARSRRRMREADLRAAEERARRAARRRSPTPARRPPEDVLASLAITPDAGRDLAARRAGWDIADSSGRSAAIATLLVIVLMPAAIITQNPTVIVLAAIPIALFALIAAVRVVRPGGQLDQGYAIADDLMEPLGLKGIERPQWMPIPYATGELHATVIGPTVLGGTRHGREVVVVLQGGDSQVAVACDAPAFTLEGGDGVLRPGDDVPPAVLRRDRDARAGAPCGAARAWRAATGASSSRAAAAAQTRWQHDLWLAERLADAVAQRG